MQTTPVDSYNVGKLNRDVNPFLNQDSELLLNTNFYSRRLGSKKVRFGYTQFLDNIDASPVRNLMYFFLPNEKGLFRYSSKKLYKYSFTGDTWGEPVQSLTSDVVLGNTILAGSVPYFHFCNPTDGYWTYANGTGFKHWTGGEVPSPTLLAAWQSRIFTDLNLLSLIESAVGFDTTGNNINGTIAVTNGNPNVVGTNSSFVSDLSSTSNINIVGVEYTISSITDNTHLTLASNYAGSTASGLTASTGYQIDPFFQNSNDPAGGGETSLNAGHSGTMVALTASIDRINAYKQFGITRYNGSTFMDLPFFGNILTVCSTKNNIDYILATNGIYTNDGQNIQEVDFGIRTIIEDTVRAHGITNPLSISFDNYTIFQVGTIRVGQGDEAIDISNGCFVHHELFDEWYIWSLGTLMTAFGYYVNPSTNTPYLISGDALGNTYVWGENYTNDNGIPIAYHLRTVYKTFSSPINDKITDRYSISSDQSAAVTLNVAKDFNGKYLEEQKFAPNMIKKGFLQSLNTFKTLSLEFLGSTSDGQRPEIYGCTVVFKDMEDRYTSMKGQAQRR